MFVFVFEGKTGISPKKIATRMTKKLKSFSSIYHMPIGSQFANFPIRCNRTLNISSYANTYSKFKMETNKITNKTSHMFTIYMLYKLTSFPVKSQNVHGIQRPKTLRHSHVRIERCLKLRVWQNEIAQLLCCLQMRHSTKHPIFRRRGHPPIDKQITKF